jgi:hypothetical protein
MLKLLVESEEPDVLRTLDEHDGSTLLDKDPKYFACSFCGLVFTRNNIVKHSQSLSCDAKRAIQECLAGKFLYFAKLLESDKGMPCKDDRDAVALLNMKINVLHEDEKEKLRKKRSHFRRFEEALINNTSVELPNDPMLVYNKAN